MSAWLTFAPSVLASLGTPLMLVATVLRCARRCSALIL
jgi:hypothetical protein